MEAKINELLRVTNALTEQTEKVVVGKHDEIRLLIAAMLAKGHVLLEDMPGVGKTTLIKSLSRALGFEFSRIQFTPDLLPSDVIGVNIFDRNTSEFKYVKGPVFTNILLADEINRAIPRTQSALLEAMEERQVTIDGKSTPLADPFFVLATENPVESESTFQLPAAQMDRFMVKMSLGYPTGDEELSILKNVGTAIPYDAVEKVTDVNEFISLQETVSEVYVSDAVQAYIVAIVQATRKMPQLKYGASPRASLAMLKLSKAVAAMEGRSYVIPDDVKKCAAAVMCHRIALASSARLAKQTAEDVINDILRQIDIPANSDLT